MITEKVEATVEEIHTETTGSEGALGDHTTMIGQNSWQQDFLPLELNKEEANNDPTIGATTKEAAAEAADTTVENRAARDTEDKIGEDQIGPHSRIVCCKRR